MALILAPSLLPNRGWLMIGSELIWTQWERGKVSCPSHPGMALSSSPVGGWCVALEPVAWRISALECCGGARTERVGAARTPCCSWAPT